MTSLCSTVCTSGEKSIIGSLQEMGFSSSGVCDVSACLMPSV
uniref:Uncharacterized protein n=1 Tax=Anguilla anguilla TaxID=7936 RepID=A0A0E9W2K7_ANGAN